MSVVSVACCQVYSETGRSLVQTSPAECGASEFDREISKLRSHRSTKDCRAVKKTYFKIHLVKCVLEYLSILKLNAV